ncbi:hypothetical protein PanWU01x14_183930 [Parasponia andersonii]|uniref:Uncharacterized protein n=1 Tax=Parasponia andersonii TaxID=3476 RepID=A0A2P5C4X1_PARAD|nr:hypothetical protein PanWU01x14_183930 [Parasponia andersonii]
MSNPKKRKLRVFKITTRVNSDQSGCSTFCGRIYLNYTIKCRYEGKKEEEEKINVFLHKLKPSSHRNK